MGAGQLLPFALQGLTSLGDFAARLFDYQQQLGVEGKRQKAEETGIADTRTAGEQSFRDQQSLANRYRYGDQNSTGRQQEGENSFAKWQSALNNWQQNVGSVSSYNQLGQEADFARNQVSDKVSSYEKKQQEQAAIIEQDARAREQATVNDADASLQRTRTDYQNLIGDFKQQISDAMSGVTDIKSFLNTGYANQLAGAVGSLKTAAGDALAKFDASWTGPRDQRYQAQRMAIENQYAAQQNQVSGQMMEAHNELTAKTLESAYSSVNSVRNSFLNSGSQAFQTMTGAEQGTLDVKQKARDQVTDVQSKLFGDLNQLYMAGEAATLDVEKFGADLKAQGFNLDQTKASLLMDMQKEYITSELAYRSQTEAEYTNMLMMASNARTAGEQTAAQMEYSRTFGVPLLSGATSALNSNVQSMTNSWMQYQLQQQALDIQQQQANNWLTGGLAGAGATLGSAFVPRTTYQYTGNIP